METNIEKILTYLYSLEYRGINPGLERIEVLCDLLDNPQNKFKSVIIGGTNGKGSTLAFLASILKEAGYRVGSYTSPHLEKFNERISVNGELISDLEIAELTAGLQEKIDKYNGGRKDKVEPTFFEFTTALAFEFFRTKKVDIALLEVGLGGRFDAVNHATPLLSVITNISMDHTNFLGDSLNKIAFEKAGIIKKGGLVLTGETNSQIRDYFRKTALERDSRHFSLKEDFDFDINSQTLGFSSKKYSLNEISVDLKGKHQISNAALAIAATIMLKENLKFNISEDHIYDGLKKTRLPGRLEYLETRMPFPVLLDVAHNEGGARVLADYLGRKFRPDKLVLLIGIMKDKNHTEMLGHYKNLADKIILTKSYFSRSWDTETMEEIKKDDPSKFEVIPDLESALRYSLHNLSKDQTLCITGSIFTAGEARSIIWNTFS